MPSPELSDIRMYQITKLIISKFKHAKKILSHGRFRDDGFIILDGTKNDMIEFFDIGNSCHKRLKFTFEFSWTRSFLKVNNFLPKTRLTLNHTSNQLIPFSISIKIVHTTQQCSKRLSKENA